MSRNCPLCQLFIENDCKGCPVSDRTGEGGCEGSPYRDWLAATYYDVAIHGQRAQNRQNPEALEAAKAELAFLKSLLPSDTP